MNVHPTHSGDADPSESDLDWLAFCYLAEELSVEDRIAFESRLEHDQLAREALARAVELSLATRHVFADDAVRIAQRDALNTKSPSRGWYSVALACGGLLALVVMNNVVWQAGQPASDVDELALAWSETRTTFPTSAAVTEEREAGESDADLLIAEDESVALPTWMLAAVSESSMKMSEENQGDAIPE